MGQWLKPSGRSSRRGKSASDSGSNGPQGLRAGLEAPGAGGFPARPVDRREQDERYARVIGLVESIQHHLTLQDQRAERLAPAIERLAEGLANLPATSKSQLDLLNRIHALLEADLAGSKRIEAVLSQIPQIADAQRETMVSMGRQLDVLREMGDRSVASATSLQDAMSELARTTTDGTSAIKQMHVDSASREEQVVALLETQTRRVTWLFGATIVLVLGFGLATLLW